MKQLHLELRSDTFTRPGPGMLEAMLSAEVGDDVFGEDPATNRLEQYAAELFGFDAGLYCVSGTMANQIAISVYVRPGDEVICDALSHIYLYEGGGIASNSMASVTLLEGDRGRIKAKQIQEVIKEDNVHYPVSRLVSLENTMNKGGGSIYEMEDLREIRKFCSDRNLSLHLDGARLCNAIVARNQSTTDYAPIFDSISVCLSKGLGAPMGSVLLGTKEFIHKARRVRKRWGGGWRQSGFMASAGLFALRNNIPNLANDHKRARQLASILETRSEVTDILPVDTNIVIFSVNPGFSNSAEYVRKLASRGLFASPFGTQKIRLVTHLDFTDSDLNEARKVFQTL
jgi:threonine aldolase